MNIASDTPSKKVLNKKVIGNLLVLTTTIIYSFNTNFMKSIIPEWISPFGLVLARTTASTIGFFIIAFFMQVKKENRPQGKAIGTIMLGGLLGIGANLLFYIKGISLTLPIDAFVVRTAQPIIVILLAVIFLGERFTKNKFIGIILGMAGTVYIVLAPNVGIHSSDPMVGDIFIFIASVCSALFLILIKPYTVKYNLFWTMAWMSLAAFILTLPFGFKELTEAPLFHQAVPAMVWFKLSYILFISTMAGYALSVKALNYISPFIESLYIYLLPITGAIVAILMGLQKFSWHDPIALVLIILGFIKVKMDSSSQKVHPKIPQQTH